MKLEHKILTITLVAIALAVPVAFATQHRTNLLNVEKTDNKNLRLDLKTKTEELQLKNQQLEQERQRREQLEKENAEQKKQLEAKAAAKEAARVAALHTPNCDAYRGLVAQYDWPVNTAMAVMQAESGCRAITPDNSAANYDHVADHGLFQLHGINVTDPAENVRIAYQVKYIGAGRSFTPWVAYNTGAYLKFL